VRRLGLLIGWLALVAWAHQATTFSDDPTGTESGRLLLWVSLFAVLSVVIILGALLYGRRRARGKADAMDAVWVAVPVILVAVVAILGAQSLFQLFSTTGQPAFGVQVTAHRYWWDFDYAGTPVRLSNELVLPAGVTVELRFTSTDAFHALSVPEVGLKASAIPGQNTRARVRFKKPGSYLGFCTEQCGLGAKQHRMRVLVIEPEAFDRFLTAASNVRPPAPATPELRRGAELFGARCASCHTVRGTAADGASGPDLTLFGNRTTLGAASLPNTPTNLRTWIRAAPDLKPDVRMPAFPDLGDEDLDALAAYLEALRLPEFDFTALPQP
jgi:cytochrome c oxidase subunit 2